MTDEKNNTGDWNTGNWNTGNWNTGYRNTGNRNTGDWNTGYRNTGDWNTGDWNTGDWNTGYFNVDTPDTVRAFGKGCSREAWDNADKPDFLYFNLIEWVGDSDMSDQEKVDNPTFHTTGGYLKSYEYQEAFQKSWDEASEDDRKLVEQLPNFDADIFLEISGIDVRKKCTPAEVIIDGVKYIREA